MNIPGTGLPFLRRQSEYDEALEVGYNTAHLKILRISGAYPDLYKRYTLSCIHVMILYLHIFYYLVAYVISIVMTLDKRDSLLICKLILYCCVVSFYTLSFVVCHLKRRQLDSLIRTIGSGFFSYFRPRSDKEVQIIQDSNISYHKFKRLYLLYKAAMTLFFSFSPVFKVLMSGKITSVTNSTVDINEYGVMPVWRPMDTSTIQNYLLAFLLETVFTYLMLTVIVSIDLSFVSLIDTVSQQFLLLAESINQIYDRAVFMYKGKLSNNLYEDEEFQKCLYYCLTENIRHHQVLLRYHKVLQSFSVEWLIVLAIGCTGTICLSGFLTVRVNNMDSEIAILLTISNISFLIETTTGAFIYCWYSEKISDSCIIFQQSLYNCPWPNCSTSFKKALFITILYNQNKEYRLLVKGIVTFSLDTFAIIIKRSYSYFNLLTATA